MAALGIMESGCTVSSYNPIYTAREIHTQIEDSQTKLFVCFEANYAVVKEAVELSKKPIKIICVRMNQSNPLPTGAIDFHELVNVDSKQFYKPSSIPDFNDTVFLPYSSGTYMHAYMITFKNFKL